MVKTILAILLVLGLTAEAGADTIYLNNGRSIEGIIYKEDGKEVSLEVNGGFVKFSKDQINKIKRSSQVKSESIRQQWLIDKAVQAQKAKDSLKQKESQPKQALINDKSGSIFVEAMLNKKVKVNLILDTGASWVVLSSATAEKLGIGVSQNPNDFIDMILADGTKARAQRMVLDNLSVQGSELNNVEAVILPKQDEGLFVSDGLLGMSFLKRFSFKIDQKNKKLILEKL